LSFYISPHFESNIPTAPAYGVYISYYMIHTLYPTLQNVFKLFTTSQHIGAVSRGLLTMVLYL